MFQKFMLIPAIVHLPALITALLLGASAETPAPSRPLQARLAELDAYWAEVSRAVREGDYEAYVATCHPEAVLVSGRKGISQPLAVALERWKQDFDNTREGKVRGSVEFRFSERLGDATTAHETGIFHYVSQSPGEEPKHEWMHLVALLVKRGDSWLILMEHQLGPATQEQWDALR